MYPFSGDSPRGGVVLSYSIFILIFHLITGTASAQAAAVDLRIKEALVTMQEYRTSVASTAQIIKLYESAQNAIVNCCNAVLARYQALNMRVRDVKPPAYFGKRFIFPAGDFLELPILEKEREIIEGFPKTIQQLEAKAKETRQQIRAIEAACLDQRTEYFAQIEHTVDKGLAVDAPPITRPRLVYQSNPQQEVHHAQ